MSNDTATTVAPASTPAPLAAPHITFLQKLHDFLLEAEAEAKVVMSDVMEFAPEAGAIASIADPEAAPVIAVSESALAGVDQLVNANSAAQVVAGVQALKTQVSAIITAAK